MSYTFGLKQTLTSVEMANLARTIREYTQDGWTTVSPQTFDLLSPKNLNRVDAIDRPFPPWSVTLFKWEIRLQLSCQTPHSASEFVCLIITDDESLVQQLTRYHSPNRPMWRELTQIRDVINSYMRVHGPPPPPKRVDLAKLQAALDRAQVKPQDPRLED